MDCLKGCVITAHSVSIQLIESLDDMLIESSCIHCINWFVEHMLIDSSEEVFTGIHRRHITLKVYIITMYLYIV